MARVDLWVVQSQTRLFPVPGPKSTSRSAVQGSTGVRRPFTKVSASIASNRNVALTMVAPALPEPPMQGAVVALPLALADATNDERSQNVQYVSLP